MKKANGSRIWTRVRVPPAPPLLYENRAKERSRAFTIIFVHSSKLSIGLRWRNSIKYYACGLFTSVLRWNYLYWMHIKFESKIEESYQWFCELYFN